MSDVNKLYSTTVQCVSTVAKSFSFLPPHGRRMQPGEVYTFPGDLGSVFGGNNRRRQRLAFKRAIEGYGDAPPSLIVLETPVPQAIDSVTGRTYGIGVTSGTVAVIQAAGSSASPPD